jgi:hypothetical protein
MFNSRAICFFLLSFLVINTSFLLAQSEEGDFEYSKKITLQASLDFPASSFANYYKMGYGINAMAEFYWFDEYPDLALTGGISLATFSGKNNDQTGQSVSDTKYDSFSIKIGGYYYIFRTDLFDIYAGLLIGVHFLKGTNTYYGGASTTQNYGGDNAETKFGYSPLIGATYPMGKSYGLNLTLRYNDVTHPNLKPTHFSIYGGISLYLD